jgi:AcrR family transcriptional regulator
LETFKAMIRRTSRRASTSELPSIPQSARPYHHGALPEALLQAAETVLIRDGLKGLSLRAIAREAGVSHTAPQHHFGDLAGVLSELVASGHTRLAQAMADQAKGKRAGRPKRKAIGHGYIEFAMANQELFKLMSRNELLDATRPSLIEARRASALAMAGAFQIDTPDTSEAAIPLAGIAADQAVVLTAAWGFVHGLAMLLVDNRLNTIAQGATSIADARALVTAAIDRIKLVPEM